MSPIKVQLPSIASLQLTQDFVCTQTLERYLKHSITSSALNLCSHQFKMQLIRSVAAIAVVLGFGAMPALACECYPSDQGQYCGWCGNVINPIDDYVYECNPSGGCYEYGYRVSCAEGSGPCGPGTE